jgi:hypothetical protein
MKSSLLWKIFASFAVRQPPDERLPDLNPPRRRGHHRGMKQVIVRTLAILFFMTQAAPAAPPEDRPVTDKERARITEAFEKRSYKNVHDVEVDDGRFEADATSPNGYEVELELDMKSLKIIREHRD